MLKKYSLLFLSSLLFASVYGQNGVGINTKTPKSTLDVNGSFGGRTTTVTANTTLDTAHFIVICDNPTDITITLPSAAISGGRLYFIKRINMGRVFINPNGSDSIDDTTAWVQINPYQLTSVVGEGNTKWIVLNDGVPNSGGSSGTGLTNTDRRNAGTNTPAVKLSNFTGAVLDSLKIDVDTATAVNPGLLTPAEKLLINSISDTANSLRMAINNHILLDEDTDSTNELQLLSISNDTLYLSNGNMVYLGSISNDNDQDSANELITNFSIVMDSLSITDNGGTYTISIKDIIDTTSLSDRIVMNLDSIIKLRTDLDAHILADEDLDSTNELQMLSISNDTLYLSDGNNVYLGAISSDNDQDSTNEYNTAFEMNAGGDSLIITDKGTRFAVSAGDIMDTMSLHNRINTNMQAIIDSTTNVRGELADTSALLRTLIALREAAIRSALVDSASAIRTTLDAHILADEDLDSTNELQMLSISNDTLYLSDGNNVYLGAISSDNDQDSTNEYNTAFEMNTGGDSLIITDKGTRFAVSAGDIMDTMSLHNRINTNMQAIIDSTTNVRGELADTSALLRTLIALREAAIRSALVDSAAAIRTTLDAHILADEDLDSTNELQMLSISNDTLYLSDGNNVYLGAISSDNDQDSTNEYNTAFEMNTGGDSLIITDKGTRFAVSAGDIMDTMSLHNRINTNMQAIIDSTTNVRAELADTSALLRTLIALREAAIRSALVDSAAAIRTTLDAHILADEDLDSTNELQMLSISNDTLYLSDGNNVYLGAISSDNDQDSTNEYNTAFEMNAGGDSLIITDKGTRFAVSAGDIMDTMSLHNRINTNMQAIIDSTTNVRTELADTSALLRTLIALREAAIRSALVDSASAIRTTLDAHILADEDLDSTNELQMLSISNDTLYLSDGNNVYLGAISSDNDQDSTNEYNTAFEMNAGGDSLIITDKGTRFAVSAGDIMDTMSLHNRINTNMQAIIDSTTNVRTELADTSALLRTLIALREAAIRSALVDSASAIRTTLDAHILADEDLDSTNELQMLSISNDTLYLSDGNNVYLGAISSDNDQDSTNEYNTAFEMNTGGDSLIITDKGTRFAVSAGDIMDTMSLHNRINTNMQAIIDSTTNVRTELADTSALLRTLIALREAAIRSALVDSAAAIRTTLDAHILADEDLDSTNELQMLSISNDTLYLSDGNNVYLGAISSDNDQDSTNEYNTAFEMNAGGDSLIITDKGTRFAVSAGDIMDTMSLHNRINTNMQAIIDSTTNVRTELADTSALLRTLIALREAAIRSALVDSAAAIRTTLDAHILADEDLDSTNELQMLSISNDTLYLSDGNNVYLGAISSDNDQDSTNEYNTAFEMNAGGDSLIITDKGTRFAVSAGDIMDTMSLHNRINTNMQAIIDSTTNVRTELADTSALLRTLIALREAAIRSALVDSASAIRTTLDAHILADEDLDSTNELQMLSISNDTLYLSDGNNVYLGAISSDNDQDSTNEYNTAFEMNAGGDSLIITDKGTRFAVSAGDIMDTMSLHNRINTNMQAIIDSTTNVRTELADTSALLRTLIALREAAIRSALVDSASAIRTTLDAHILADEDLDSTNELQMLSISNDTLYLSDGNNVYLGAISSDNDQDSTNEYNTAFEMNAGGDSLIITDKGTRFAVSTWDIVDTTSLSDRIVMNLDSIIKLRTDLDAHVLADEDTDSTNEYNTGFLIQNDSLIIVDNGDSLKVSTKLFGPKGTTGSVFYAGSNGTATETNTQLFWDSANNRLGIGTNSPTHKLHVVGQVRATSMANANGTANAPAYRFHSDGNTGMFRAAADQLGFSTNGTEAMRIDNNQNVGFGDNISPTEKVDVDGTIRLRDVDTTTQLDTVLVIDNTGVVKKTSAFDLSPIYAAGKVAANGTAVSIKGATVSRIGAAGSGEYQVTFTNALPNANYIIQLSQISRRGAGNDDPGITYYDQETDGFKIEIGDNDNGGTDRNNYDGEFMFTIIVF